MELVIVLNEQQLNCLKTGRRIRGSLFFGANEWWTDSDRFPSILQKQCETPQRSDAFEAAARLGSQVEPAVQTASERARQFGGVPCGRIAGTGESRRLRLFEINRSNYGDIMKWPNFENPLGSLLGAELADIEEACLRGELSREDFETYVK